MTSKKRRQRGSRTHGGGTHKNRRGAGHRGGRGRAGRDKHEFHNYEPLGKHGFTRPEETQDTVAEVRVQKLDEDAALLAADGLAEQEGDAYHIDARDVAEDGYSVDVVKVLGGGQVRNELHVTADAFTSGAVGLLEEAGGAAELSERGQRAAEEAAAEAEADEDADETEDTSDEANGA
jgi:large subunit ribosomal protein L15